MIQPHSGAGKGFHFIPEIGEEVLVGFENGNAEKPFVLGTHYNGSETSGYHTPGNDLKVIHTRSGTKIILNDAQGSVFIEDPSGNTWTMDGQGNINVNAPKNITFTAGENITMTAGMNINQGAGASITETAGVDHAISAGAMMTQFAAGDFSLLAKNIKKIAQENINSSGNAITKQAVKDITVSSEANINKHAKEEVAINSGDKTKNH
ncbi:phage baseplate assembly protein V [Flavobacterium oreochromis]|nr:phage baseplate assembly protein V [Flavobacterium oreochromis]